MSYLVIWDPEALAELRDLPKQISDRITKKVETYLALNPRQLGEALLGGFSGLYRYRVGDYRVIYEIHDAKITIHVVRVGHRRNVYDE